MINAFHISDVHLSFDAQGKVLKPMDQRKWSVGVWTYQGYLKKIRDFGLNVIRDSDFVFITGDITHDMKEHLVRYQLRWLRDNIRGTIVICRGNHDKYWDVGKMKTYIGELPNFYIIDEGEITSIGPYTIGCYSDHRTMTKFFGAGELTPANYLVMARQIADQAKAKSKTAIMLSHYPVTKEMAEVIGEAGVKAYLSGHVHCTNNEEGDENGIHLDWYNQSSGQTDDKFFNECFFSTGTSDVLLVKHDQIFKNIVNLQRETLDKKDHVRLRSEAARVMKCKDTLVTRFERQDPFNTKNEIAGFICRKKGPMGGSLYITHVNGIRTEGQLIYGVPKLEYPYKSINSTEYMDFPRHHSFMVAEKLNGMNVLFFKYYDEHEQLFISAKSKGAPFLGDSEIGNFLSLTKEVIDYEGENLTDELIPFLETFMFDEDTQSISYELYGTKEPHLVKYTHGIGLMALFKRKYNGGIKPCPDVIRNAYNTDTALESCKNWQTMDLRMNEQYRNKNNLPHKYEFEHFATEGKVLYLLNEEGYVINNIMYKIKPSDIEEVHWSTFNDNMQGLVRQAVRKMRIDGTETSERNVQAELDMGPKEWNRFGKSVMHYIKTGDDVNCHVVVLCGTPGSGKSTVSKVLKGYGYEIVNQDLLGSRKQCRAAMERAIKGNKSVVIDRCNFDEGQRITWIQLAKQYNVQDITCVVLDVSLDDCIARASARENHPTIKDAETAERVVKKLWGLWQSPAQQEGFSKMLKFDSSVPAHLIAKAIKDER